jgi:hypothetical protein
MQKYDFRLVVQFAGVYSSVICGIYWGICGASTTPVFDTLSCLKSMKNLSLLSSYELEHMLRQKNLPLFTKNKFKHPFKKA